jgi:hypothetical protein
VHVPRNHQIKAKIAATFAIAMNHAANTKQREKPNPQKGTALGNFTGGGKIHEHESPALRAGLSAQAHMKNEPCAAK